MGLGPSIKMTSKHHYFCPVTKELLAREDIDFLAVVLDGVSENCDEKVYTAKRTADIVKALGAEGVIVAIDGWGNHHVDFVSVMEECGKKGILSVGLSYIGLQGRLVCDSPYVDTIIDFNKNEDGYENCVVGGNNINAWDAKKAVALLKRKVERRREDLGIAVAKDIEQDSKKGIGNNPEKGMNRGIGEELAAKEKTGRIISRLKRRICKISQLSFGDRTELSAEGRLSLEKDLDQKLLDKEKQKGNFPILEFHVRILSPEDKDIFVHSNLDFLPIVAKERGEPGEGISLYLEGVTAMLNGVEEGGFEPCNIGSSEGILSQRVKFQEAGTAEETDWLLQGDFVFREGEGRTAEGIEAAHSLMDTFLEEIRREMRRKEQYFRKEELLVHRRYEGCPRLALVKISSGLGNMYDTVVFPKEPAGILEGHQMRLSKNLPYVLSPLQVLDGVIHTLL